jgi:parallel beta-helix repeat protein
MSINNRDNKASNITATNNCEGIRLFDADHNDISGNNLSGNIQNAISFVRAHDNMVASNTANNTGAFGGGGAFAVGYSNGNVITSNIISNTQGFAGIRISGFGPGLTSNNNVISGNTINNYSPGNYGIRIDGDGSNGNAIQSNTVSGPGVDLADFNMACINTWTNNTFATDNELGGNAGPAAGCIR